MRLNWKSINKGLVFRLHVLQNYVIEEWKYVKHLRIKNETAFLNIFRFRVSYSYFPGYLSLGFVNRQRCRQIRRGASSSSATINRISV